MKLRVMMMQDRAKGLRREAIDYANAYAREAGAKPSAARQIVRRESLRIFGRRLRRRTPSQPNGRPPSSVATELRQLLRDEAAKAAIRRPKDYEEWVRERNPGINARALVYRELRAVRR